MTGIAPSPSSDSSVAARIQVAPALLAVLQRQQHLRHRHALLAQHFLVGMGQADLPDRGRGLAFLEAQGARGKPQLTAAQGDGARRTPG